MNKERRWFTLALCVGTSVGLLAGASVGAATTLHMTTEYPATSMPGLGLATFADLVKQKTNGEVIVEATYDSSMGIKSADMIDAVEAGKTDAGDAFAGALAKRYPIFGVSSLPFLADSIQKARTLTEASTPAYRRLLIAHHQKLLYTTPWPASGIWSKTPIKTVADLRSLNIRTYDDTSRALMARVGAKATNMSFSDAMPRIAAGEVNAVLSSGDGGAGRKLWQYLPHFTEINYALPISVATISMEAYTRLDADSRRAIDEAAAETDAAQWTRIRGRLEENYENMRMNGVAVNTDLDPDVLQTLVAASRDSLNTWLEKTGPEGAAIMKAFEQK